MTDRVATVLGTRSSAATLPMLIGTMSQALPGGLSVRVLSRNDISSSGVGIVFSRGSDQTGNELSDCGGVFRTRGDEGVRDECVERTALFLPRRHPSRECVKDFLLCRRDLKEVAAFRPGIFVIFCDPHQDPLGSVAPNDFVDLKRSSLI